MSIKLPIIMLLGFIWLTGCAVATPGPKTTPWSTEQIQRVKIIAMLPPQVEVEELGAGGGQEQIDEWTTSGKANVAAALSAQLSKRAGLTVKVISSASLSPAQQANLKETQALFNSVDFSARSQTGAAPAQSLGSEVRDLAGQADAMLVTHAHDHIGSSGRKALQTGMTIVGALVGVVAVPNLGATTLSAALADAHTGSILWYNSLTSQGGYDLRDPVSAAKLVEVLFKDFPVQ